MKHKIKKTVLIIIGVISICFQGKAQSFYKISDAKSNNIKLSGTSTLHDWTMNAPLFSGEVQFGIVGNDIQTISAFNLLLQVKNLKSKEKGLDNNAYKALKAEDYKAIVFKLSSATKSSQVNDLCTFKVIGKLSLAGVTKEITMIVYCLVNANKTITCTGSQKILMSNYDIKPPSFMFGTMSTGDAVTLDFNITFKK